MEKKGMELREKNGTEKRAGVEVEKESIERKCPDSENSSSQPFCLNLAEKRKKKDLKEDELAEERARRTPPSENSVFAHPRKFRNEKRTKKVSFSKLEREASDIGNKYVEEVPSSKLKRKIENSDGLEALLVKETRHKLNDASGHPSIGAPKKTTKKPQLQQEGSPSEMSDRSRKSQGTSHDKGKKDKEAATTTSPVKPWRELAVERQTSKNASLNEKQRDGKEGTHEGKSMESIKSRENASRQKPVQTNEKVPIKLSSELKHAAKSQEELEDQEEDVASNFEHYTWKTQHLKANLVHGKFTKKEDEELKKAIFYYIREQGLDENEGLAKVLNSSRHKDCRGCWQQVSKSLPHRSFRSLYARAHRLLMPGTLLGKWKEDEVGALMKLHKQHGNNWKTIAEKLGRYSYSCKDKWREAKLKRSKGKWTLEEYEKLHMLVHTSLRVNAQLKKDPSDSRVDHRHFRDNVNWQFISDQMGTRTHANCLNAWYNKVASSMVSSGDWAITDDALLLQRIMEDCLVAEEWVEWDCLLEHRSGEVCHKRWQEMQRTLREQLKHSFIDQLEALIQIFSPELLEDEPSEADKKFKEDYDAFTSRQVSNA